MHSAGFASSDAGLPPSVRIYYAVEPVDMRNGIDGLRASSDRGDLIRDRARGGAERGARRQHESGFLPGQQVDRSYLLRSSRQFHANFRAAGRMNGRSRLQQVVQAGAFRLVGRTGPQRRHFGRARLRRRDRTAARALGRSRGSGRRRVAGQTEVGEDLANRGALENDGQQLHLAATVGA
jgi:hypothetical protein